VMVLLAALTGHETGATSWADAAALKTRGNLWDVSHRAVCLLPEHEALPPVATSEAGQRQYLGRRWWLL
jgi:hypothetical protein